MEEKKKKKYFEYEEKFEKFEKFDIYVYVRFEHVYIQIELIVCVERQKKKDMYNL